MNNFCLVVFDISGVSHDGVIRLISCNLADYVPIILKLHTRNDNRIFSFNVQEQNGGIVITNKSLNTFFCLDPEYVVLIVAF